MSIKAATYDYFYGRIIYKEFFLDKLFSLEKVINEVTRVQSEMCLLYLTSNQGKTKLFILNVSINQTFNFFFLFLKRQAANVWYLYLINNLID